MKKRFFVLEMPAIVLALGLVLLFVSCQTTPVAPPPEEPGALGELLRGISPGLEDWGTTNGKVWCYYPDYNIKDEFLQAVKDAGYVQTGEGSDSDPRTADQLRWAVPLKPEKPHQLWIGKKGEKPTILLFKSSK